jgi:Ca2+-binding RTX toxin-like protein
MARGRGRRKGIALLAGAALAATAFTTEALADPYQTRAWIAGKTLKIRDASTGDPLNGDFDNAVVVKVKRDEGAAYVADDYGSVIAGPGCVAVAGEDTSAGRPEDLYLPDFTSYAVKCTFSDLRKVDINTGPGDDAAYVLLSHVPVKIVGGAGSDDLEYFSCEPPPYFSTSNINGGLGDDYIVGGQGDDVLTGQRGDDYLEGTCGHDRYSAGSGFDDIKADDTNWCDTDCPPTTDRINCGDGDDSVDTDGVDIIFKNCEVN